MAQYKSPGSFQGGIFQVKRTRPLLRHQQWGLLRCPRPAMPRRTWYSTIYKSPSTTRFLTRQESPSAARHSSVTPAVPWWGGFLSQTPQWWWQPARFASRCGTIVRFQLEVAALTEHATTSPLSRPNSFLVLHFYSRL